MSQFARLDREHENRIKDLSDALFSQKPFDISDIFPNKAIVAGLDQSKVILPEYDLRRILAAYPFSKELYVTVCPVCSKKVTPQNLRHLLEYRAITPVLIDRYENYDPSFLRIVLPYPHISLYEFMFYRYVALVHEAKKMVCTHCVDERRRQYLEHIQQQNLSSELLELIEMCLTNLFPFINPDYELIEQLGVALKANDIQKLLDIVSVTYAVRDARTNQAYGARSIIPAAAVSRLVQEATSTFPNVDADDVRLIEDALASDLHLQIPANVNVAKYLSSIEPYRKELAGIVDGMIEDVRTMPSGMMTSLSVRLGELNDELKKLSRSKSYLAYRASVAFMRSNSTIIASGLLATALGLTGNVIGCGASLAGGIGARIAKRFGKLNVPKEVNAFFDEVKHTARPYIHKLVAKYVNVDIRAVQLWEINEKLGLSLQKSSVPTKRSSGRLVRRR